MTFRSPAVAVLLALLLTGCGGDDGSDIAQPGDSPSRPDATSAPASPSPSESASPTFPPEAPAEHGGEYWAVFLAVVRGVDARHPEIAEAVQAAKDLGYSGGHGEIGCTQGAAEQLRLDPAADYMAVSVFFASQAQAQQFVDAYEPGVVGTAKITAYCMD